jgi:hypothetical protein
MMKRVFALLLISLTVSVLCSSPVLAEDGVSVTFSGAEAQFPSAITFTLEAEADSDIVDIDLEYRVSRRSLVGQSCRVDVDFTPGESVVASWRWDMLETGGLPPGTEVEYWWCIEDADNNMVESSSNTVRFDDLRYDWSRISSDQVNFYWYEGDDSFLQELVDAADAALDDLAEEVGVSLDQPANFYIYANPWDLHGALVYPDEWTGGVAFPAYNTIAIGISPGSMDWGKRAIAHELGHLVVHQYVFGPYGALPTWLDEGLAMDAEGDLRSDLQQMLEQAIARDTLFSISSIASSFPADPNEAKLSYAESYSVLQFLIDNYGSDKIVELLQVFKEGSTDDEALLQVYGFDTDGLGERWRVSLGLDPEFPERPGVGDSGLSLPYIVLIALVVILGILTAYLGYSYLQRMRY